MIIGGCKMEWVKVTPENTDLLVTIFMVIAKSLYMEYGQVSGGALKTGGNIYQTHGTEYGPLLKTEKLLIGCYILNPRVTDILCPCHSVTHWMPLAGPPEK